MSDCCPIGYHMTVIDTHESGTWVGRKSAGGIGVGGVRGRVIAWGQGLKIISETTAP